MFQCGDHDEIHQHTLARSVSCVGIGLHSGARVSMTIRPARGDAGITFIRRDVRATRARIRALWSNVVDTTLCTVLGNEHGVTVSTVEHVLAALHGCGVDNAEIEIDGAEVPIVDGSAAPFVTLIDRTGVVRQAQKRHAIVVHRPVSVRQAGRYAALQPDRRTCLTVEIDFTHPGVGRQRAAVVLAGNAFRARVAPARTFGFADELASLRARGLALGGSVSNAIVVGDEQVINAEGLRFHDEFVRHKLLDCIGDLALAGGPVLGHLHGYKPGHRLNHALIQRLFSDPEAWSSVRLDEIADMPLHRHDRDAMEDRARRSGRGTSSRVA